MAWDEIKKAINSDLSTPLDALINTWGGLIKNGLTVFEDTILVVPPHVYQLAISGCGGGGGGGCGGTASGGASGGSGAACILRNKFDVIPGDIINIAIGKGGAGAVYGGSAATAGGATVIGNLITLAGGLKGNNATASGYGAEVAAGGTGGGASGRGGQNSYAASPGLPGIKGLGGAAGAGATGAGSGGGGSFGNGGKGGDGLSSGVALNGSNGGYGAGGGGGAAVSGSGGNGGDGFVVVELLGPMVELSITLATGSGTTYVTYTGKGQLNIISSATAYTYYVTVDAGSEKTLAIAANSGAVNIPFYQSIKIRGSAAQCAWFVTTS